MASRDLVMGSIFLSQTSLGILGNSALLCQFIFNDFCGVTMKSTDLIIKHLTYANIMVLLFRGIPQTMTAFGLASFLDDDACKLAFYFHRVGRGVSICSTSLLSISQAITVSSVHAKWVLLRVCVSKIIPPSLALCWVLQPMINVLIPMSMTGMGDGRNLTRIRDLGYCCAVVNPGRLTVLLYSVLLISTDVLCLGLMAWASGLMVSVLLRHKQRVQHIHSSLSARTSPETRATQSILILATNFVLFYLASATITLYLSVFDDTSKWLVNTSAATATCFPVLCPFLLLRQYVTVSRLCCACSCQPPNLPNTVREFKAVSFQNPPFCFSI